MIEQQWDNACFLQFSSFLQFPHLVHGVFTRDGGYSEAPYKGLNTSGALRGGDDLDNVVRNRQLALRSLRLHEYPCITLWNVHGADILIPDGQKNWRTDWAYRSYYEHTWTPAEIHKGDALITQQRGIAIAFSFADCTPIALYDPLEQVIGITHGGWRGTARGIAIATIEAMCENFGCQPRNIYACIGPTIGPCCYEISQTVQDLFLGLQVFDDMPIQKHLRNLVRETAVFSVVHLPGKDSLRLDLWETNRRQLLATGLLAEHIEVAEICTSDHVNRFFSHRAEHGKTGRFPMIMALTKA